MMDQVGWPSGDEFTKLQVFKNTGGTTTTDWQVWIKPRNARMVYIWNMGAGAGGGGGLTGAAGTARGGGSGGGSAAIVRQLIPAFLLPDRLYLMVGRGGNGGNASGAGTAGPRSYISTMANQTAAAYLISVSGAADAAQGVAGTATTNSGGAAGTIARYPPAPARATTERRSRARRR